MEKYLGVKLISAESCWGLNNKCVDPMSEHCGQEVKGYKVVYEDGYTSWSPKDVFEKTYRKIRDEVVITKNPLQPHENRVLCEVNELKEKIEKLQIFINNNKIFETLSEEEKVRLRQQLMAMQYYLTILIERIENF